MASGEDDARSAILARRARMVAMALLGSTTVTATACACLSPMVAPDAGVEDAGVEDAGADGATEDATTEDADE